MLQQIQDNKKHVWNIAINIINMRFSKTYLFEMLEHIRKRRAREIMKIRLKKNWKSWMWDQALPGNMRRKFYNKTKKLRNHLNVKLWKLQKNEYIFWVCWNRIVKCKTNTIFWELLIYLLYNDPKIAYLYIGQGNCLLRWPSFFCTTREHCRAQSIISWCEDLPIHRPAKF